jgi:hypothetical protein
MEEEALCAVCSQWAVERSNEWNVRATRPHLDEPAAANGSEGETVCKFDYDFRQPGGVRRRWNE